MRRFHFRLETLLRFQKQRQRLAELAQAQAYRQWWECRQQVLSLEGHAQVLSEQAWQRLCQPEATLAQGATFASAVERNVTAYWFLLSEHVRALQLVSDLAQANEAERRQIWEQCQQERLTATRKTEMLEVLRHQALEAFRRELDLYQQRTLDEAALRAWWYKDMASPAHNWTLPEVSVANLLNANQHMEAQG